jgi:hypothetical protein
VNVPALYDAERDWSLHYENEVVPIANPAAGAAAVYTVPGSVEQELLAVSFKYTASGNAATRIPFIQFVDWAGVPFCEVGSPFTLVATNVSQVTFGVGVMQFGANSSVRMGAGIPPMILGDGLQVKLSATAIDVADTITLARMFVRQRAVRPLAP